MLAGERLMKRQILVVLKYCVSKSFPRSNNVGWPRGC